MPRLTEIVRIPDGPGHRTQTERTPGGDVVGSFARIRVEPTRPDDVVPGCLWMAVVQPYPSHGCDVLLHDAGVRPFVWTSVPAPYETPDAELERVSIPNHPWTRHGLHFRSGHRIQAMNAVKGVADSGERHVETTSLPAHDLFQVGRVGPARRKIAGDANGLDQTGMEPVRGYGANPQRRQFSRIRRRLSPCERHRRAEEEKQKCDHQSHRG
jgi:hypothetical protein